MFHYVASRIIQSSGACPRAFCDAIDRVFARSERKALYTHWEESTDAVPPEDNDTIYDFDRLGKLLLQYLALMCQDQTNNCELLDISQKMIDLMGLTKPENTHLSPGSEELLERLSGTENAWMALPV